MIGIGGKLFSFLPFGAQIRILGNDFIPVYFGEPYDMYRAQYYAIANNPKDATPIIESTVGWYASTGFSLFKDLIVFNLSIDGPFKKPAPELSPDSEDAWVNYPHIRGSLVMAEGLLPGFSFSASLSRALRTWSISVTRS